MKTKRSKYQISSLAANLSYKNQLLQKEVEETLRDLISESEHQHPHYEQKAIKANVFNYTALTIFNDNLTFLDADGYHYSLYAECTLTDLIDIIQQQSHENP